MAVKQRGDSIRAAGSVTKDRLLLGHRPVARLILQRIFLGIVTLVIVSVLVFAATSLLPGNAAVSILGPHSSAQQRRELLIRLHLTGPPLTQYLTFLRRAISGDFGNSLATGRPVVQTIVPELLNSGVLIALAMTIGTIIAVGLGVLVALRRDGWLDHVASFTALLLVALPDFVIGIALILLFATVVLRVLPGVSTLPPGTYTWQAPSVLVLPVLTVTLLVIPYIFRMTRGTMNEALESDYAEMATLRNLHRWRVALVHAIPNALPAVIQVVGISAIAATGGLVVVENVFNYPGIGQALVSAVQEHDVPVVQFIVLVLACFYISVNIITDICALIATPRRRLPR